jgi:hypothetical protein
MRLRLQSKPRCSPGGAGRDHQTERSLTGKKPELRPRIRPPGSAHWKIPLVVAPAREGCAAWFLALASEGLA